MANPEHLAKLKEGVEVWNQWRVKNRAVVDLRQAPLAGLNRVHFEGSSIRAQSNAAAVFFGVNLSNADLRGADLDDAGLRDGNLSGADLRDADLRAAILRRADLTKADLRRTDLSRADLSDADLSGARLGSTIFANTTLSGARGLELCEHFGPSSIGIDTFFKSQGDIPESFLRGCGVPEQFITYARSLVGRPIEFYSCFISYSTKDQDFADRLYADLQNNAVRCWFAPHDIAGGKKVHEQIDEAIRFYDRLLLILSEHSMKSSWVETEISKARKRELLEGRRMLFPVRLVEFEALRDWECFDADTGKDSAREIREYFIPDFSNWKDHNSYKGAFDRLLRDLKTNATMPPA